MIPPTPFFYLNNVLALLGLLCLHEVSPHTNQMTIIGKSTNNKYWRDCGEKGTFPHHRWEYKLVVTMENNIEPSLQEKNNRNSYHMIHQPHFQAYSQKGQKL